MRPQQFPVHAASQAFNLNPGFGATKYLAQQPFLPDALGQDVMGFQHSLNDFTTQRISDLSQSEGLSQSSSQYPNITGTPSTNFQCTTDGCNKIFTGKGAKIAYNRHINSHKRPYPCPESSCNRHTHGFSRKDNLKNHIDRLHPMTTQKPLEHHTTNRTTKLRQNHGFRKLDADSSLSLELLKAKVYRIESMARNLKKMCGSILSMIEDSDEDNRMADMSSEDEGEDVEE
ncbi:hypothetical protein BZA77DRAFT_307785 [Pyronema omphalodes]|nr:hypothetical protein BZA77DRAFT_307785 [Pyronema omphalodes]